MVAIIKTNDNGNNSVRLASSQDEARRIILEEWFCGDIDAMDCCKVSDSRWEDWEADYVLEISVPLSRLDE